MKIIDIQLGRGTSYGGSDNRVAQPWKATIYSRATNGGNYSDEVIVPEEIAKKMALAAYDALVTSGFLSPDFEAAVTPAAAAPDPEVAGLPESEAPMRERVNAAEES